MFLFLLFRGSVPKRLSTVASALLNNLSLLFIPAGVGVMAHVKLLGDDLWPLSVALILSTVLTIAVTAWVMVVLNRRHPIGASDQGER